jgi:hypothetical protein
VTLCAAASVNVRATVLALEHCLEQVDFADCLLFSDSDLRGSDPRITRVPIGRLCSARDYSEFILTRLADFVRTPHCLIAQWDGFVIGADRWDPSFFDYDYIGAPWPQFTDGKNVGNGGFSLRSRRLLEACRDRRFRVTHPEDLAVCRVNRGLLENDYGIRFADEALAAHFSFERGEPANTFGFHGVFNMIPLLGQDRFWALYELLDDKSTAFADYWLLMRQLSTGRRSASLRSKFTIDLIRDAFRRRTRNQAA